MSRAPITYDRSLLVGAPALTRQDRQAGYDVDALERGPYPQPNTIAPTTLAQPAVPAPDAANPFQDGYYDRTFSPSTPVPPPRPWWKRKRWAALALIIFLGIICGIIAGVVTARNSKVSTALISDTQNANSGSSALSTDPSTSQSQTSADAPIFSQTTANPPIVTTPTAGTNAPVAGNQGTTIFFGSSTSLPPGVSLPTATVADPNSSGEIPYICYVTPTSRACAPYFNDPPRV
jgi:hypothetical protein